MPASLGRALPSAAIEGLPTRAAVPAEFSRAWLAKTDRVRRRREELRARGLLDGATPAELARWGAALEGRLRIPVVVVHYADVDPPFSVTRLGSRLFEASVADTVSLAGYWDEVSGGLLQVDGVITSWIRLRRPAEHYLPTAEYGWGRFGRIAEFREQALSRADVAIDFAQFDNDGPDGVPDSGDDDGHVDFVAFYYATGCGSDGRAGGIWPHRGAMSPFRTGDRGANGERILITDYVVLPAQAAGGCDPAHVGVLAHETAHALGLPDLYDYDGSSRGIGSWGLLGTGSHVQPHSPAHPAAWAKEQLGWVRVDWTRAGLSAAVPELSADRRVVRHDLDDGSGRYLLLERRSAHGSDRHLPGHGLLVWGIDPERGELGGWNSDERSPAVALLTRGPGGRLVTGGGHDFSGPFPGRMAAGEDRVSFPALLDVHDENGLAWVRVRPLVAPGWAGSSIRLTAVVGGRPMRRSLPVRPGAADGWVATARPKWLRLARSGDGVLLEVDPHGLPPGTYTDSLTLRAERSGDVLDQAEVVLEVTAPGRAGTAAREVAWSWGLAARDGVLVQTATGWDPFGVRPRPRLLQMGERTPVPTTLTRLPVEGLYAPTFQGDALYVVGRVRNRNYIYRVDSDGNAAVLGGGLEGEPAYGLTALPGGDVLMAGWSGRITRVTAEGEAVLWAEVGEPTYQIASAPDGTVYAALLSGDVMEVSAGGHLRRLSTGYGYGGVVAVAVSADGRVFAAERSGHGRIVELDVTGAGGDPTEVTRVAGGEFYGLAADAAFLYGLDLGNRELVRIALTGPARSYASEPERGSRAAPARP